MISQTTEYALRVMVYLASLGEETPTIAQISSVTRVPSAYLAKVLRNLARSGLIRSQRGLHGGSSLSRTPEQITIFDVVQAVDPIQRITSCPLGLKSHGVNLCPLHRRLDQALASVEEAFRQSTLAEVVAERASSKPLCEAPAEPTTSAPMSLRVSSREVASPKGHRKPR